MKLHFPFKNLIVACAVVVFGLCFTPEAAALSGSGTQEDPYLITTPGELEEIHQDLDGYYRLAKDINLIDIDWTPVGSTAHGAFTGTLDGQGHTISNLILRLEDDKYVGLFGYLEGTVTNLTLSSVNITAGRYAGAVAGYTGVGGSVTDCHVTSGTVLSKGAPISVSVGGITGWCDGELTRCTNDAAVTAKSGSYPVISYAGGIAGYVSTPQQMEYCSNSGKISVQSYNQTNGYVGGLVGWLNGSNSSLTNCSNSGKVTGSESAGNRAYVMQGGLVGDVSSDAALILTDCTNTGTVGADYLAVGGGMLGYAEGGTIALLRCENSQNVSGTWAGGMVGGTASSEGLITVTDCTNSGTISGNLAGGLTGNTAIALSLASSRNTGAVTAGDRGSVGGGIVGECSAQAVTVHNCSNFGNVGEDFSRAGGIVGGSYGGTLTVSDCINRAWVRSYNDDANIVPVAAGGIVGVREGGVSNQLTFTITNCENAGSIASQDAYALYPRSGAGGILGWSTESTGSIDQCVNRAAVTISDYEHTNSSYTHAGGITGYSYTGRCTVSNCTNYATVTGRNAYGVVGYGAIMGEHNLNLGQLISSARTVAGAQVSIALRDSSNNLPASWLDISNSGVYLGSGTPALEPMELVHKYNHSSNSVDFSWSLAQLKDPESGAYESWDPEQVLFDAGQNSGLPMPAGFSADYMDQSVLVLKKGATAQLTAPFVVSKWLVSDGRVSCSDGSITALATGASCVSAVSSDGRQANTIVLVYDAADTTLSQTILSLYPAGSKTLHIQSDDARGVVWSSSAPSVATVSNAGVVTALVPGTAEITATIPLTGQVLKCAVSVVPAPVSEIKLYGGTVGVGAEYTLSRTISPTYYAGTITWISTCPEIATVDENGIVTGVSVGQTTITAKADSGVSATCTVTVNRPAQTITLNHSTLTLEMGYLDRLTAVLTPEDTTDTVSWSSSSSCVSIAADGTLTPKREGTATITARTSSGLTATCFVTVKAAVVQPESITLSHTQLRPIVGEKVTLTASLLPANTTETTISWSSSNEEVATVNDAGVVEAHAVGTAVITATASNGVFNTCQVTVSQASSACFTADSSRYHLSEEAATTVSLLRNPGIAAFTMQVEYDAQLMKPIAVISAELLSTGTMTTNLEAIAAGSAEILSITWYSDSNISGDGAAFVIHWQPLGEPGTSPVTLSLEQDSVCNSEGYSVRTGAQNGQLLLTDYYIGDIYQDQLVNMMDIVYLARWFNGLESMDAQQTLAADITYDGAVTVADLTSFAQMLTQSIPVQQPDLQAYSIDTPFAVTVSDGTLCKDGTVTMSVSGQSSSDLSAFRFALNIPDGYCVQQVTPCVALAEGTFVFNEDSGIAIWYSPVSTQLNGELFTVTLKSTNPIAYSGILTLDYAAEDFFSVEDGYRRISMETLPGLIHVPPQSTTLSTERTGNTVAATLESNCERSVLLIVTAYKDGQMCAIAAETCQLSRGTQSFQLELEKLGDCVKLFLLENGTLVPLDCCDIP